MIHFNGCKNISIKNLELDGNMEETVLGGGFTETMQVPTRGIFLNACQNITIDNVNVHDFGYDGITVYYQDCGAIAQFPPQFPPLPVMNCNISNSFFTRNGRNNMTWGGGIGMNVFKTEFNYAGQGRLTSQPGSGIDIEFEQSNMPTAQGSFVKCKFKYNRFCGVNNNSAQNLTQNVQYDYKFIGCEIVGSETGIAAYPNARQFLFDHCNFVGHVQFPYSSILGTNNPNNDNIRFTRCNFSEEYLDPEILPWVRKSFANTPSESVICGGPEHRALAEFQWLLRGNFNNCTFSTNYTLKIISIAQEVAQSGFPVSSFNLNTMSSCHFLNHGLNACECDNELTYINYTDFGNDYVTIQDIPGGMRGEPITGCPIGRYDPSYYYRGQENGNNLILPNHWQPDYRSASIDPPATKYLNPIHPHRETSFFWCSPCPNIVGPTYYSCEPPARKSSKSTSDQVVKNDFSFMPNPANNFISLNNAKNKYYKIIDCLGTQVRFGFSNSEANYIDIASLPSGIYFFIIDNIGQKFIKI